MLRNLIDGLPLTSQYAAAMANDEEYIRAVIAANGGQMPQSKHQGPALTVWTQEASTLAKIADLLQANNALLIKINSKPGTTAPKVEPEPRPTSAWVKLSMEVRLGRHRSLARRLLGDRAS